MIDTNKVFLTGKLGQDPKTGLTKNMKTWANGSIATTKFFPATATKEESYGTVWTRLVAWGKVADALAACRKGDLIYVEGELENNTYEKEGKKVTQMQVQAKTIMKGYKNGTGESQVNADFGSGETEPGF